jgi:hypothetical protein
MTPDAREQARHQIAVMQAWLNGKPIRGRWKTEPRQPWKDVVDPIWNFGAIEFEVKPEERKPREVKMWVNPNLPECIYPETWTMADATGWTLVPFVEVLPSENTGGNTPL